MKIRETSIDFAKAIYDEKEINAVVECLKAGWLGAGKITEKFEKRYAEYIGVKYAQLVNSGSSANLLSVRACNLPEGTKVLSCAAGFPSTLNVIWHSHLSPVVVDIDVKTLNINLGEVEKALKKHKIGAMIFAHTLGNPVDMKRVMELAEKYNFKVIEDNCDSMGSGIYGKRTGSFGDFHTMSFYASHHITCGGMGGMVGTNDEQATYMVKSMKEWGKGQITTGFEADHGVIFDSESNGIPYDHRYSYPNVGYNFKLNEMSAAFGLAQMDRINEFNMARRENYKYLREKLEKYSKFLDFVEVHPEADPAWFNFPVTLKDNTNFTRKDLVEFLENHKIRTRLFFAGNILAHEGFKRMKIIKEGGCNGADKIHKDSFLIGIHPAQTKEMLDYIDEAIGEFIKKYN
ncbi:hypothetical protein A3D36_02550 [Candidatus Nomurabacteria bacterium RIFCSPHIGHO2_02_FULL_36_29]|nr:MAG: hypothetical protein A3D36_02550 [Candidatus Nomurabacteria bacterium RIFCSPHIGHO2_02_FULL_36_29]